VVGGRAAGEVAARHARGEADLGEYPSRIATEMGRELANSVRIREVVDRMMRSDRLMDALFAMLPPEQMKAIMRGQIPGALERAQDLVANR
jgi:hypothetical protein